MGDDIGSSSTSSSTATPLDGDHLRSFVQAQLIALATSARDEKVRLGALERLDDQLGTVKEREHQLTRAYGGSATPTISLALQQNVFSTENTSLLVESLKALAGGGTPEARRLVPTTGAPPPEVAPSNKEPH